MAIPKVVGIEQEYAITFKGRPSLTPFDLSCHLINAYARGRGLRSTTTSVCWDYAHETPFLDIRGPLFSKKGGQLMINTSENQLINSVLPNGARFYTDHAHPEYSTPECIGAREAVSYDKAGESTLRAAILLLKEDLPGINVSLFKNNTDTYGHSYGTHENYLMDSKAHTRCFVSNQEVAFRVLIPFLVTRQIYAGAGKVGSKLISNFEGFQISQRAEYMEKVFGLETMHARSIVNTRAEHHADANRFRRLHLIVGDANMCEFSEFTKLGATQIVLQMMEEDFIPESLSLKDPINAIRSISYYYNTKIELDNGKCLSALDIQRYFLEQAVRFQDSEGASLIPDYDTILNYWDYALDGLQALKLSKDFHVEEDPFNIRERIDWVLKLWILNRQLQQKNMRWNNPLLNILDLQYHNIDYNKGLYFLLQKQGAVFRILDDEQIRACITHPPNNTRAYFRGMCIQKFYKDMFLINWEVIGFTDGNVNRMVPLLNPLKGTRDQFENLFLTTDTAQELINKLESEMY